MNSADAMGGQWAGVVPQEVRREMKRAAREALRTMATGWHHGGPHHGGPHGPHEGGPHEAGPHRAPAPRSPRPLPRRLPLGLRPGRPRPRRPVRRRPLRRRTAVRPGTQGEAGRRPRRDPRAAHRGLTQRLPDHPGDRAAQPGRLEAQPGSGLPGAAAAHRRGTGPVGGERRPQDLPPHRRRPGLRGRALRRGARSLGGDDARRRRQHLGADGHRPPVGVRHAPDPADRQRRADPAGQADPVRDPPQALPDLGRWRPRRGVTRP